MNNTKTNTGFWFALATLTGMLSAAPALADDTEIFLGNLSGSEESEPNVLFILDTSGSMGNPVDSSSGAPTRLEVMQNAASQLVSSIQNVNMGLMRFSSNGQGGMVVHPIEDIDNGRSAILDAIAAFEAGGNTPLSETLYEAGLYYLGQEVKYGVDSTGNPDNTNTPQPFPSVAASRTGTTNELYLQPDTASVCRKNYIVMLTDGEPVEDFDANSLIPQLNNFQLATGNADCIGVEENADGSGRCLEDMAAYMFNTDVDSATADTQNVVTYTIGFGPDVEAERLERTALRGGGKSFAVQDFDPADLQAVFNAILAEVREKNTTFAAPAVAVNSFNRTQNLDDLYFGVFKAQGQPHWDGNLKKYRLVNGEIVGVDTSTSAVDPATGFFKSSAQSYWSPQVDGFEAAIGGAASQLPGPITRTLFTSKAGAQLAVATNNFDANNITNADLAISPPDDALRTNIIDWTRGQDVFDEDGDGDTAESRKVMGDPLHSSPAVVVYGGSPGTPDPKDAVVFFGTNDGLLHAIDAKTGAEQFAFLPKELLRNLKNNYTAAQQALNGSGQGINKAYGIDGSIQVLRKDVNGDGIINAGGGDQVVLYFGMRRGEDVDGNSYYFALDVSNRNSPSLLWVLGPGQLPNLGQTWSVPMLTRVNISGATQNTDNDVLVFGGGYSTSQDSPAYSTDSVGNAIFMVDAQSGSLLWSAGNAAPHNLVLTAMDNSIPANVRVLDLNNDQFADRMYVGDMGGRIWRFDVFNGQTANQLVTGGVIASLGAADLASPTVADNRRFYNSPDVSFVPSKTGNYLNIAIGSGYRAHPLNQATNDRFYGIRDYNTFNQLDQTALDAITASPIVDNDPTLVDVTSDPSPTIPPGAPGWKFSIPGEKVLGESRTFDGTVIFTSFSPVASTIPCEPGQGLNKLYQVNVLDGSPVTNLDGIGSDVDLSISDRSRTLAQTGIAPTPTFIFPSPQAAGNSETCTGDECSCEGDECGFPEPRCLVGLEACDVDFGNPPVRTFWTQLGIDPP